MGGLGLPESGPYFTYLHRHRSLTGMFLFLHYAVSILALIFSSSFAPPESPVKLGFKDLRDAWVKV